MPSGSRTCLTCREAVERGEGLRLVLGPDGLIAVDYKGKLPGRGAWTCWSKDCITGARTKGRLARAFRQEVRLDPDPQWPLGPLREVTNRRQRELMGLALRAGQLKAGGNLVRRLLERRWPKALVLAEDTGETVARGWMQRARGSELPVFVALGDADALGEALGRSGPRSILALGEGPLIRSLLNELKRGTALL